MVGKKCDILEKRSTTTKIASKSLERGKLGDEIKRDVLPWRFGGLERHKGTIRTSVTRFGYLA